MEMLEARRNDILVLALKGRLGGDFGAVCS